MQVANDGALWVGDYLANSLTRLPSEDLATPRPEVVPEDLNGGPNRLAASDRYMWVLLYDSGDVARVPIASAEGRPTTRRTFASPASQSTGLVALDDRTVWFSGQSSPVIWQLAVHSKKRFSRVLRLPPGTSPQDLLIADETLWVADYSHDRLLAYQITGGSPRSHARPRVVKLEGGPIALEDGGGLIWVALYDASELVGISARSSGVSTRVTVDGLSGPHDIAFDPAGRLYIGSRGPSVVRLDAPALRPGTRTVSDPTVITPVRPAER